MRRIRRFFRRRRTVGFYRQFVGRNELIFDIGANRGALTALFAGLGARVVAVEPQPDCAAELRGRNLGDRVTIVESAVGAEKGEATIRICDADEMSSMNAEFIRLYESTSGHRWSETQRVPMTTLDAIIAEFGEPSFCVIDVEGSEADVVSGLSHALGAVRAEFHQSLPQVSSLVIARLEALGTYQFNYSTDESRGFDSAKWIDGASLKDCIAKAPKNGHIYARLVPDVSNSE